MENQIERSFHFSVEIKENHKSDFTKTFTKTNLINTKQISLIHFEVREIRYPLKYVVRTALGSKQLNAIFRNKGYLK